MTKPKLTEPECADLLGRLAPDWPLLLHDGAVIDHILKVINNARGPYRSRGSYRRASDLASASACVGKQSWRGRNCCLRFPIRIRVGPCEEAGMIGISFSTSNRSSFRRTRDDWRCQEKLEAARAHRRPAQSPVPGITQTNRGNIATQSSGCSPTCNLISNFSRTRHCVRDAVR